MVPRRVTYALLALILALPTYLIHLVSGLNVLDVLILAVALMGLYELKGKSWTWPAFTIPALLLLVAAFISIFIAPNHSAALGIFKSWFVLPIFLSFVVAQFEWDEESRLMVVRAVIAAGTIAALYAGYRYLFFNDWVDYQGVKRAAGFFNQPNYLAMYLVGPILLSLGHALKLKQFRVPMIIVTLLSMCMLVLSYSRGGMIALAITLLIGSYIFYSWRGALSIIIITGIFFGGALSAIPSFRTRFSSALDTSDQTTSRARIEIDQASKAMLRDHPILGVGLGGYQAAYETYHIVGALETDVQHPHNLFLAFWTQTGLLGIIAFLALCVQIFLVKPWKNGLAATLFFLSLIATLLFGFFDTPYWKNDLALLFWVPLILMYKPSHVSKKS